MMALFIWLTAVLQSGVSNPNQFNDFLLLGYVAMWLIGIIYVLSLSARQRNLRKDIQLMRRLLQEEEDETA
jgi:hypothetical protein